MSAQLLATFGLLFASSAIRYSDSARTHNAVVGVYLKAESNSSATVLASLTTELESLLETVGYQVEWLDWKNPSVVADAGLAVLELRGTCLPPITSMEPGSNQGLRPLASTSVVAGQIFPFSHLNCEAVNQFLGSSLIRVPTPARDEVYGRALARLLGHELYHILARTTEHTRAGVAKARFTVADLLSDDFQFTEDALFHLQAKPSSEPVLETLPTH
jgi:hypothetical protein